MENEKQLPIGIKIVASFMILLALLFIFLSFQTHFNRLGTCDIKNLGSIGIIPEDMSLSSIELGVKENNTFVQADPTTFFMEDCNFSRIYNFTLLFAGIFGIFLITSAVGLLCFKKWGRNMAITLSLILLIILAILFIFVSVEKFSAQFLNPGSIQNILIFTGILFCIILTEILYILFNNKAREAFQ